MISTQTATTGILAVAVTAAETSRTDITVYADRAPVAQVTVYSEWPADWNTALAAHGFDIWLPWAGGAPMWAPYGPYGTSESTTREVRRR
ncbi:hypothetical protein [Nocardia brasiliensis]|uniref:hypothetical protein n=1 Tax=Nocardia brasiliensis TaxID=37326 RepID=UPI0024553198|nr:hypothetical protein [Nocardia brasiliensis]